MAEATNKEYYLDLSDTGVYMIKTTEDRQLFYYVGRDKLTALQALDILNGYMWGPISENIISMGEEKIYQLIIDSSFGIFKINDNRGIFAPKFIKSDEVTNDPKQEALSKNAKKILDILYSQAINGDTMAAGLFLKYYKKEL